MKLPPAFRKDHFPKHPLFNAEVGLAPLWLKEEWQRAQREALEAAKRVRARDGTSLIRYKKDLADAHKVQQELYRVSGKREAIELDNPRTLEKLARDWVRDVYEVEALPQDYDLHQIRLTPETQRLKHSIVYVPSRRMEVEPEIRDNINGGLTRHALIEGLAQNNARGMLHMRGHELDTVDPSLLDYERLDMELEQVLRFLKPHPDPGQKAFRRLRYTLRPESAQIHAFGPTFHQLLVETGKAILEEQMSDAESQLPDWTGPEREAYIHAIHNPITQTALTRIGPSFARTLHRLFTTHRLWTPDGKATPGNAALTHVSLANMESRPLNRHLRLILSQDEAGRFPHLNQFRQALQDVL